jgi:hypothetical protein
MPDREFIKREVERLTAATRAEMKALADEFRRSMQALVSELGDPDVVRSKIDRVVADYERRIRGITDRLDTDLDRHFPKMPRPSRGPFEEPRRRPPSSMRRRLPKWPPDKRPSAGGVTVERDKPSGLSGGAAAPLESD